MKNLYKIEDELYIISNTENINENCWIITDGRLVQISYLLSNEVAKGNKIILTTNKLLIADGVQAIDDKFLEWFVKNPSCENVKVEKEETFGRSGPLDKLGFTIVNYKIIIPKEEPKQEIVGYRLKSHINRIMVDNILKNVMPIWNDEDKSVYFIRGHVAGSLVEKMRELQVLDLWFTPIYEFEEVKSDWVKQNHLDFYYKEGIMSNEPKQELERGITITHIGKQETLEEFAERIYPNRDDLHLKREFKAGAK